jgi:Cu-Zn family superoxide dismutase
MRTLFLILLTLPLTVMAEIIDIPMFRIGPEGTGAPIGHVIVKEAKGRVEFLPALQGLVPGKHGFHIHEKPDCGALEKEGKLTAGLAAGSHYDPEQSGKHLGPEGPGHRGDLPVLLVGEDGSAATGVVLASRLNLQELHGRSLMIHAEADNYGDQPGGARVACGIIP